MVRNKPNELGRVDEETSDGSTVQQSSNATTSRKERMSFLSSSIVAQGNLRESPNPRSRDKLERRSSRHLMDGVRAPCEAAAVKELAEKHKHHHHKRKAKKVLRLPDSPKHRTHNHANKTVGFENIYLREYARTVGDNPSCSGGPPIGLSWEYSKTVAITVDKYETQRASTRKQHEQEMILSREKREYLLRDVWEVSNADIAAAVRESGKIKNSRRTTVRNSTTSAAKVEHAVANVVGQLSLSDRQAQKLHEQHAKAAQVAIEKEKELEKAMRQHQIAQKKSLSSYHFDMSDDDKVDEDHLYMEPGHGTLSLPVAFADIVLKVKKCHRTYPRSSLLQQTSVRNKNVCFAANPSTFKIWSLVKEFPKIDVSLHELLWWSEDDMEHRYHQDQETVGLVGEHYGVLLRRAYKSTKGTDQAALHTIVDLDFDHMDACSTGRGLESEVIPEIRDLVIQTHYKVVMNKQEANLDENDKLDDEGWEVVRGFSLRISNASRLIALKLAEFDHHDSHRSEI